MHVSSALISTHRVKIRHIMCNTLVEYLGCWKKRLQSYDS